MATQQPGQEQQPPKHDYKNMSRGQLVDLIFKTSMQDVRGALRIAIDASQAQGTDDPYETAVALVNAAAVQVPGTKTIWTERRIREFIDRGVNRPGL